MRWCCLLAACAAALLPGLRLRGGLACLPAQPARSAWLVRCTHCLPTTARLLTHSIPAHPPTEDYNLALGALTGAGMFVGCVVAGRIVTLSGGVRARGAQVRASERAGWWLAAAGVAQECGSAAAACGGTAGWGCVGILQHRPLPAPAQVRDIATQLVAVATVLGIGARWLVLASSRLPAALPAALHCRPPRTRLHHTIRHSSLLALPSPSLRPPPAVATGGFTYASVAALLCIYCGYVLVVAIADFRWAWNGVWMECGWSLAPCRGWAATGGRRIPANAGSLRASCCCVPAAQPIRPPRNGRDT